MTLSITHKFLSAKADSSDGSLVRPSNWNDEHKITMAAQTLLGRGVASDGNAGEISTSADFDISANKLSLSDAFNTSFNRKANKNTLVEEQPALNINHWSGGNWVAVYNTNSTDADKNGRISFADFKTAGRIVDWDVKVIGGNGLYNSNAHETLNSDVTIHMITPATLTSTTTNNAPDTTTGHTHDIDTLDVARDGCGSFDFNTIGSAALMRLDSGPIRDPGFTTAGSNLKWASAAAGVTVVNSGTWMLHGWCNPGTDSNGISVWMRIVPPSVQIADAEYRNPAFNADGSIDVELHYVDDTSGVDKWQGATLNPKDDMKWYVDMHARVLAEGGIAAYVAPTMEQARASMQNASSYQIRRALLNHGITTVMINEAIATRIADPTETEIASIDFGYGQSLKRSSASVTVVLSLLGFSPDQQDALWQEALAVTS